MNCRICRALWLSFDFFFCSRVGGRERSLGALISGDASEYLVAVHEARARAF